MATVWEREEQRWDGRREQGEERWPSQEKGSGVKWVGRSSTPVGRAGAGVRDEGPTAEERWVEVPCP